MRKLRLYLFSTNGKYYRDASSINALKFLKKLGLNHRVHDTRHTFITNMLNSGMIRITDLAQIVGHSNTQMIMTVYAKFIKGEHLNISRDIDLYSNDKNSVQTNIKGTIWGTVEKNKLKT